ncbi:MAG: hypothetical protein ACJA06_000704 [Halocynthiibacter sp.]|jgi:hypothetical protein
MRFALLSSISFVLGLFAGPLAAHPGHLVDQLGHDHWVAGAAAGAAIAIALWGALKGKSGENSSDEDVEEGAEPVPQEA